MNNIGIKLKEVYLPFLIVSIGTILFYNLFRWSFDIKLGLLPLKEDLLNFWIPFLFPWIPILIWLRRRVRILNVRGRNDNGYFGYQAIMCLVITVPIIVSQSYIQKGSFNLIEVNNVNEITKFKNEKYFKIRSFQVNKSERLPYATARTSGKNNENLTFYLYISCHFENSNNVWYGVEYSKNISNRISDASKNSQYNSFLEKSENEFELYDFQNVTYFEKIGYTDERDGFLEAINLSSSNLDGEHVILIPINDDFDQRLGNNFFWIFGSFLIGAIVFLIMTLIPKIDQNELADFKKGKPLKEDDLKDLLFFLNPIGANQATAILILLNLIVFIIMIFSGLSIVSPTAKELLEIGGNRRTEVLNGDYWRLFTSMFIHGGIIHLLMNLAGLAIGAFLLESILGRTKLLISYIVSGLLASLASIYYHENTVSVGASGAIFGLYGLILAFTVFKIYPKHVRGTTWMLLGLYAGLSLIYGFLGGIDNAAHFGGLISGFIIGVLFILVNKKSLIENAN